MDSQNIRIDGESQGETIADGGGGGSPTMSPRWSMPKDTAAPWSWAASGDTTWGGTGNGTEVDTTHKAWLNTGINTGTNSRH